MAPTKTVISALTSQTKNVLLHVRVTRIWESISIKTNTIFHTNVVFVDEEGSHIAAKVWNNQKDDYFPMLSVGLVYDISEFIIVAAAKEYRPVDRDLALTFYYKTKIRPLEDTESIPTYKFDLKGFESIPPLLYSVQNFIEVIGMVEAIGNSELTSKGAQKTDVRLINDRKQSMIVTLWEDKATQFRNSVATANGRAAFVVITGLLAKKFSTAVTLSSGDGTTTYCNIDYAPLNDLKKTILQTTGHTVESLPPPTTTRLMHSTADAPKETTLQGILETVAPTGDKVIRVLCEATIVAVSKYDNWFYNCCPKCPSRIRIDGDKLSCKSCREPIDSCRQGYRTNVRVEDDSGKTTFTLFNKEVERLVGMPIEKVVEEIGKDKLGSEAPPILNNMIGKKCLFEVKITSKNTPGHEYYAVARLFETLNNDAKDSATTGLVQNDGEGTSSSADKGKAKKQKTA